MESSFQTPHSEGKEQMGDFSVSFLPQDCHKDLADAYTSRMWLQGVQGELVLMNHVAAYTFIFLWGAPGFISTLLATCKSP